MENKVKKCLMLISLIYNIANINVKNNTSLLNWAPKLYVKHNGNNNKIVKVANSVTRVINLQFLQSNFLFLISKINFTSKMPTYTHINAVIKPITVYDAYIAVIAIYRIESAENSNSV